MTDRVVRTKLEADGSQFDATLRKSTGEVMKHNAALGKSGKAIDVYDTATKRAATGTEKLTASKVKASQVAMALGKAANTAKGGMLDVANAAASAVSAFGPWGVAVGLAAGALIGYASNARAAADETRKLERELGKQRSRALDRELDEKKELMARRSANAEANKAERDRLKIMETANDLKEIENALAQHGRGKDTLALQKEETRIRAENLRIQGDAVGAAQAERDFELHTLEILGRKDKARKGKASGPMFKALSLENSAAGIMRDGSDTREFAGEMTLARAASANSGGMQRAGSDTRDNAAAEATLRRIDLARAEEEQRVNFLGIAVTDHDAAMMRISEEQTARLTLATTAGEAEQIRHEATLQRIDAEKQAEAERMEIVSRSVAIGADAASQTVTALLSITDARRNAINAAKAQGKTDREAARAGKIAALEQTAGQLQALRNLAIQKSIEQLALGIGAQASTWGIPNPASIGHFVAAGVWAGVAGGAGGASRGVASAATGMRRNDYNAAEAAKTAEGGKGGVTGGRSGTMPNTGPIPGSPGPQTPSSGTTKWQGGNVVQINGPVHLYGTPHRRWLRDLTEAQDDYRQGSGK